MFNHLLLVSLANTADGYVVYLDCFSEKWEVVPFSLKVFLKFFLSFSEDKEEPVNCLVRFFPPELNC